MTAPPAPTTRWSLVVLLIGAGLLAACQIGKAAVAVPQLRHDLGLGLAEASWVVGAYGALGAAGGLAVGALIGRIGSTVAVVGGLLLIAIGSLAGAFAAGLTTLAAARVTEGCGFLGVVIGAPAMLGRVTAPRDRDLCFALWGAYMPVGTAAMMMAGPLLMQSGWRPLWIANGALALSYAMLMVWALPRRQHARAAQRHPGLLQNIRKVMTAPGPVLLALAFGTYTFQYFALTALLPTLLVERMGLSLAQAGTIGALVVLANAGGNVAAGGLMRLGIPLWATGAAGFACVALCSFGVFSTLPTVLVSLFAAVSLAVSGAIPASIFAGAPQLSPAAHLTPLTLGLIMQLSNLGQLLGPAALAAWVERLGWASASMFFALVGAAGVAIAAVLRTQPARL